MGNQNHINGEIRIIILIGIYKGGYKTYHSLEKEYGVPRDKLRLLRLRKRANGSGDRPIFNYNIFI